MNNLKNKVMLIGNLGMDPDVKELENGKTLTRFALATSETYKSKTGERKTDTQWHNIVLWGKLAQIAAQYCKKGQQIVLEGKLSNRTWEDNDGQKHYVTEIVGSELMMIASNRK